jgi:hypothetical protein
MSWECNQQRREVNVARISIVDDHTRGQHSENEDLGNYYAYMAKQRLDRFEKDMFLLDGAATVHMIDQHVKLENEKPIQMVVSGVGKLNAVGRGMLIIQGVNLGEAIRVPGLGINLISEGALQTHGCTIISRGNWRKIYKNGVYLFKPHYKMVFLYGNQKGFQWWSISVSWRCPALVCTLVLIQCRMDQEK